MHYRQKDFFSWAQIKDKLHLTRKVGIHFKEREIWWCSLGINIGHEEDGKNGLYERPVLVFKRFNSHIFWGIPLTSTIKENKYYHCLRYHKKERACILSQMRILSSKRLLRKLVRLSNSEFKKVQEKMKNLVW